MWSKLFAICLVLLLATIGCEEPLGANWKTSYDTIEQIPDYRMPMFGKTYTAKLQKIESVYEALSLQYQEHQDAITHFLYVKRIILGGYQITTIKTPAFENMPLLKPDHLSGNKIATWEFNIVAKVDAQHYQPWNYDEQQWLSLQHNSIRSIPTKSFEKLPNLLYINLGHNQIECIDEGAFEGLYRLEVLDLSYNRIRHLPARLFAGIGALRVLNLFNNQLTYVSDEILQHMKRLRELVVLFNPWQCGCYSKIVSWAHKESVDISNKYLKCSRTNNLNDIPTCVITSNLMECVVNQTEDLSYVLYLLDDFECYFQYEEYTKY